jgi:superfamily II DNA or RNA helicase
MMMLDRMVLGDSTGLGKTIVSIAAYSWLLDKDPTLKLLVVTPKSAMLQWGEEFEKFTQGITVKVITAECPGLTGPEARKRQYEEFKEDVMVINYDPLRSEYEAVKETLGNNYSVVYDECFEYHTPIILEDGTSKFIGKIFSEKKPIKVLSYNEKTGKIESKKIVNFFRSPNTDWWIVGGKEKSSVKCSPSHLFSTPLGEKKASDLKVGDTIYGVDQGLNPVQKQVLLGSLLGDGGLQSYKRFEKGGPTAVTIMQSFKRARYFFLKTFVLAEHLFRVDKQKEGWNKVPMWYGHTTSNPLIRLFIRNLGIISNGRRTITDKIFEILDPIGLAIWYCDDGATQVEMCKKIIENYFGCITISTHCFTKEENQLIIDNMLKKWGFKFELKTDKRGRGCYLYASGKTIHDFFELIKSYIPKCMAYKLPKSLRPSCGTFWESAYKNDPFWELYEDTVMISEPKKFSESTHANYKFNIEVEDNHNYFANGILVRNCTAFKNRKAITHFACKYIAESARRVYGLSATIIKNGLEEVWGIYDVVVPGLFGNITKFRKDYCVQELMKLRINGKERRIPKTIGYKNLPTFKQVLDPYLLIRKKEEVATELPKLISRKVVLDMLPEQKDLYRQALSGILYEERVKQEYFEITDRIRNGQTDEGIQKRFLELKEKYDQFMTTEGRKKGKLAALTYCQMVSNGPQLLNVKAESSKELEFERLMKEELSTEKVILFTRFASGIPYLEIICERNHIPYTKITGSVTSNDRLKAQHLFQDTDCPLIFITTAGSAAINLQAASVILLYDTPWAYGDLVQTLGRAQRIGSLREHILVIHFINKGTIDVRVMSKVSGKKNLSDEVLGDTAVGALDFTRNDEKLVDLLYDDILEDAKDSK